VVCPGGNRPQDTGGHAHNERGPNVGDARRCGHGDGPKRALPTFEVGAGQSGADQNRAMAVAVRVRGSSARAIPATKAC
jgi:hypothetical protein